MLIPTPVKRRGKKLLDHPAAITPPAFALVSAVYSINDALVTLTFNRSINADEIDTHAFKVYDGLYTGEILDGATYDTSVENGIVVYFDQLETYSSATCLMNVAALNGIKDALTGASWAGVTGYELTTG